jgi:hypothetical protein
MMKLLPRLAPLAAALVGLGAPLAATAGSIEDAYLGDLEITGLSEDDLDELRGGFLTPLGFEVEFGAVVTATVDGALALRTEWTVTDAGLTQTVTGGGVLDTAAAAAGGINLPGGDGLTGVVIPGDANNGGGATAIFQGFDLSGLSTAIINTASNRNIKTDTQLTIEMPATQLESMAAQKAAQQIIDPLAQRLSFGGL